MALPPYPGGSGSGYSYTYPGGGPTFTDPGAAQQFVTAQHLLITNNPGNWSAAALAERERAREWAWRGVLNRVGTQQEERRISVSADREPIPLVYGRGRVGGLIFTKPRIYQGNLVLGCIWCLGLATAVETVLINGEPPADGVTVTTYLGTTTQGIDATLAAVISGYADTLVATERGQQIGVCYSVISMPPGKSGGWPRLEAIIQGRKVYDPRDAAQNPTDPATWKHSRNPALALADFLTSRAYGGDWAVDWASVAAAADACDEPVGGQPRRQIDLVIDRLARVEDHIEALRTYAGCRVVPDGDRLKLVPNRPAAVSRALGPEAVIEGTLRLGKRPRRDVPTVVEVQYTDASAIKTWRTALAVATAPGVDTGATPRRVSRVSLPGITRHAQALREAIERLNGGLLCDLEAEWVSPDEALADQVGDVVALTHPIGLSAKALRLVEVEPVEPGRWRIRAIEYDAAVYSDATTDAPSTPDTTLPSPLHPPALTGLAAAEEVYRLQNGLYASRIRASWSAPEYPYLRDYEVRVYDGPTLVWSGHVRDPLAVTPALKELVTYAVRVRTLSSLGIPGAWAEVNVTTDGKYQVPGDVPSLTGWEAGGTVHLRWEPAQDVDIWRYEVRYAPVGDAWDSPGARLLDRVDALRLSTSAVPAGTWDFMVKALDSVGQYSPNATRRTLNVSSDAAAFTADEHVFSAPTVTNMAGYTLGRLDTKMRWVSNSGQTFAALFVQSLNTYTQPLASYHDTAASEWLSERYDFGSVVSGTFTVDCPTQAIKGSHQVQMELSRDGVAWEVFTVLTAKAEARYAQVRIAAAGGSVFAVAVPDVRITLVSVPKEQNGDAHHTAGRWYVEYDGSDDKASGACALSGDVSHTLESWVWINAVPASRAGLLRLGPATVGAHHWLVHPDGTLQLGRWGGGQVTPDFSGWFGRWFHLATTYDAPTREYRVYRMGELIASTILGAGQPFALDNTVALGEGVPAEPRHAGKLRDTRLWAGVRTQAEIQAALWDDLAGTEAGLVNYWKGSGSGSGAQVQDVTASAQHLLLTGGAAWGPAGKRIRIGQPFIAARDVIITPLGSAFRAYSVDNIVLGTDPWFDVLLFDQTGAPVDGDFKWTFKGI